VKIETTTLQVGDTIVLEKGTLSILELEICPSSRKGVIKYHVNGTHCFDSIQPFTVHRSRKAIAA
jgi:hypothetical protein